MTAINGERRTVISPPVRYAVIQQTVVLAISALVLDGGDTFKLCIIAGLLSWVSIAIIVYREGRQEQFGLSRTSTAVVKHGFWVFFLGMCVLYHYSLLPTRFYHANRMREMRQDDPPVVSNR